MKFILLGSGAVRVDTERYGPAQAVIIKDKILLFDCGRGASIRLAQAGIDLKDLNDLFFTHHHYDHNCDFPYLFLTSWVQGRNRPMEIMGPRGTVKFCDDILGRAYKDDINSRRGHPIYSAEGEKWNARDIEEAKSTMEYPGFTIKTIHNEHKAPIIDNIAYRIEAGGKSLVIVGDAKISEDLMNFAEGADLLAHECSFPEEVLLREKWDAFHTSPRQLGKWAAEKGVKKLLLKHFCLRPGVVELDTLVDEVRENYGSDGLIVGRDLLEIEL